jgi:hypothetical protein
MTQGKNDDYLSEVRDTIEKVRLFWQGRHYDAGWPVGTTVAIMYDMADRIESQGKEITRLSQRCCTCKYQWGSQFLHSPDWFCAAQPKMYLPAKKRQGYPTCPEDHLCNCGKYEVQEC